MNPRFAGNLIRQIRNYGLPSGALETVGRLGPDLGFAALYGLSVPEAYASPAEKAGLIAEDALLSTLPGILGGGIAGAVTRRLTGNRGLARAVAGGVDMAGSFAGPMLGGSIGLRPVSTALDKRAQENAELQRQMEMDGIFAQGLQAGAAGFSNSPMIQGLDRTLGGAYG